MDPLYRTALGLGAGQLVSLMAVMFFYTNKRPLFVYSTSVSNMDLIRLMNSTRGPGEYANISLFLEPPVQRSRYNSFGSGYSRPLATAAVGLGKQPQYAQADHDNVSYSRMDLNEVSLFALFSSVSVLCIGYCIVTVNMLVSGNENIMCNNMYGEHGVTEVLGWESLFWFFCWLQHITTSIVFCSPADILYSTLSSFAVVTFLALFCYIGSLANKEGGIPAARRFEMPVVIALFVCYFTYIAQTKIVLTRHFTYVTWMAYVCFDGLLVLGHAWDSPVAFQTVVNSRIAYMLLCVWMNVLLYVAC